jgi:Uma2 family endonuclease
MKAAERATLDDLYRSPADVKAELVNGEIVRISPTGGLPNRAAGAIYLSLRLHEHEIGNSRAYTDNAAFLVDLPHRKSFSPDVAFHVGAAPTMRFVPGAPVFAVEVRSEGDYGRQAEEAIARKRDDYFAAGTVVVWDVDLQSEEVIRAYGAGRPEPTVYGRSQVADAEPAVPGWRFSVEDLFR